MGVAVPFQDVGRVWSAGFRATRDFTVNAGRHRVSDTRLPPAVRIPVTPRHIPCRFTGRTGTTTGGDVHTLVSTLRKPKSKLITAQCFSTVGGFTRGEPHDGTDNYTGRMSERPRELRHH